jgi:DNA processing protein
VRAHSGERSVSAGYDVRATSAAGDASPEDDASACPQCLRRSWLLGALNGRMEYRGRDPERLVGLLELSDEELIQAVGGDELESVRALYAQLDPARMPTTAEVKRICRHDPCYPPALTEAPGAPWMLHVAGEAARLLEPSAQPAVAIVGARAASDYGMEMAHGLARGLAASGVTVVSGLAEGIAAAAHAGALEVEGPTVTVMPGGVDVCHPASKRALHRRLRTAGCALAELPCGCRPRSWCHTARSRIVVALTRMTIVVEAGERPGELVHARIARATARVVAAVPGRATSPLSRGPHELLREGAHLVRGPQDALDALYGVGARRAPRERASLEPRLRTVLEQVGAGRDTLAKLTTKQANTQDTLLALAELELRGALARGDGGRYVACL